MTDYVDPTYAQCKTTAPNAGMLWGAYHCGTGADVSAEVDNFLSATKPEGSFVLALDFQSNGSSSMSLDQAEQFLSPVDVCIG